jgi:Na+-translocating ferredoxin:NAD+ oxidoreductase subunit D
MITEPVTSPKNPLGKIVFAMFIGIFTVLFRFVGDLPEGVATSVILMNIFTMPIDKWTAVIRVEGIKKKSIVKILVIAALLIGIAIYTILKAGTIYTPAVNFISLLGGLI